MSRLRATLSSLPIDRKIAGHVDAAQREILAALRVCEGKKDNLLHQRRVMAVRRDLEKILGVLASVRRVGALYDLEDPDLIGETPPPRQKKPDSPAPVTAPEEGE